MSVADESLVLCTNTVSTKTKLANAKLRAENEEGEIELRKASSLKWVCSKMTAKGRSCGGVGGGGSGWGREATRTEVTT